MLLTFFSPFCWCKRQSNNRSLIFMRSCVRFYQNDIGRFIQFINLYYVIGIIELIFMRLLLKLAQLHAKCFHNFHLHLIESYISWVFCMEEAKKKSFIFVENDPCEKYVNSQQHDTVLSHGGQMTMLRYFGFSVYCICNMYTCFPFI